MGEPETGAQRTARGFYYLFVGSLVSTLLLALAAIVVARLLGPSKSGLYALALTLPAYVMVALPLGIPTASTRFAATYVSSGQEKKAVSFVYSGLVLQGLLSVLVVAVLVPFSGSITSGLFNREDLAALTSVAILSIAGQSLFNTANSGMLGLGRMGSSAALQVFFGAVKLFVTLILILAGFSVMGAVMGFTAAYLLSGIIGFIYFARLKRGLKLDGLLADASTAIRYALPIYVASIAATFVIPFQLTLLARFTDNSQIAGFVVSQNASSLALVFVSPITSTLFPLFSSMGADRVALRNAYVKAIKYSSLLILPTTTVAIALATPLISAVYGRAYSFAGGFLSVFLLEFTLVGLGSLAQYSFLNAVGHTRKSLVASLAGSVATLAMTAVLVPILGVFGAVAATVAGIVVTVAISWEMVRRILGGSLGYTRTWRLYVSSGLAATLVYPVTYLPLHPIIVTLIGGMSFILILVPILAWAKAVEPDDIEAVERSFRIVSIMSFLFGLLVRYYRLFDRTSLHS